MIRSILCLLAFASLSYAQDWPTDLPKPPMVAYKRAEYTQRIAVTNDRDSITPVHRSATLRKWQVPGGLENASGWTSQLYKYIPETYYRWVGNIAVWNGSNYQFNRGWRRTYPDGTYFADVLSNKGKVFAVRYREKLGGVWENSVAYYDPSNAPNGFVSLRPRQCIQCHNGQTGPGTGGYATGLVAGTDTVFSEPIQELER